MDGNDPRMEVKREREKVNSSVQVHSLCETTSTLMFTLSREQRRLCMTDSNSLFIYIFSVFANYLEFGFLLLFWGQIVGYILLLLHYD